MARVKIDYSIDFGTTNSAIARMENGEPLIKKSDTLKDTMPSCTHINKKKAIQAVDSAYNALKSDKLRAMRNFNAAVSNSFIEFKRTMGTDKQYHSSVMERDFSSEELSAEVLKALEAFITDENFNSIVVTVPAKFTLNQKDATSRAAKLAGFEHYELLPGEPAEFTIIQKSKIGSAILLYDIGIEIKSRATGKIVFRSVKGLEKNQSTPATGIINGLKTQKRIRPGIAEDLIKIAIYQGEHDTENTRAIHSEHVYDVIITGEDGPSLIPEESDVDLTIKVDTSERISLSTYFPVLDYTFDIDVPSDTTQKEIEVTWFIITP